ncbi:MAG: DUF1634 domain-containing protein [Pyrobaculum sp.]
MQLEKSIEYILAASIILSTVLITSSIVLTAGSPPLNVNTTNLTPTEIIYGLERLQSVDFAAAGIMALVTAPIATTAVSLLYFIRDRDYAYIFLSAIVFTNLLVSILILPHFI